MTKMCQNMEKYGFNTSTKGDRSNLKKKTMNDNFETEKQKKCSEEKKVKPMKSDEILSNKLKAKVDNDSKKEEDEKKCEITVELENSKTPYKSFMEQTFNDSDNDDDQVSFFFI